MKRVLLTGASGFIGRQAVPELIKRGYQVHALARRPPESTTAYWHAVDLLDEDAVERLLAAIRPTHLLHFAWYVEPGKFWAAPENFAWVRASMHLLDVFAANGGQRLVGVGTCAEYDWRHEHCDETTTPLRPVTTYGICKDVFRRYLDEYARTMGLSAAWGRIFHLYGPHEPEAKLVTSVIAALNRGDEALCTAGTQVRDYMHVTDVAAAFSALLDSPVTGAVNIASGRRISIFQLVTRIAELMNAQQLLRFGALTTRADDPRVLTAEVRRLRDEVGWDAPHDLTSRLGQTIRHWQSHN